MLSVLQVRDGDQCWLFFNRYDSKCIRIQYSDSSDKSSNGGTERCCKIEAAHRTRYGVGRLDSDRIFCPCYCDDRDQCGANRNCSRNSDCKWSSRPFAYLSSGFCAGQGLRR